MNQAREDYAAGQTKDFNQPGEKSKFFKNLTGMHDRIGADELERPHTTIGPRRSKTIERNTH